MAELALSRLQAGKQALAARTVSGKSWADIAAALDRSVVWTTSAVLGQQPLTRDQAETLGSLLGLAPEVVTALTLPPDRTSAAADLSDPLIYRLGEMVQVYGGALRELITEEFGDGIMSAIDFELDLSRVSDPKGDRVLLSLNGKFLPYRVW
ncbi:MAG: cyanase [Mycobacteriales bacterium]